MFVSIPFAPESKIVKFVDKEKKWQEDMTSSGKNEKKWKEIHDEIERKLQGGEREVEEKMVAPVAQIGEQTIVEAMSQVILKDVELRGLRHQNKVLEDMVVQTEQDRKS